MNTLKLGKKSAIYDSRDLLMAKYVDMAKLPEIPEQFGHEGLVKDWGMLGNDKVGNCVWAAAAHEHMVWTAVGPPKTARFDAASVISDYSTVTGYDPADPNTDQGSDLHEAMSYRRQTGVLDADGQRHKIAGYVWLEPGNVQHLLAAMYLFGVVDIGVRFPDSAMMQFNAGQPWTVVGGSTISGGHCISGVASRQNIMVVTWGKLQPMTPFFYRNYCDEACAMISTEFLHGNESPEGFAVGDLIADLGLLKK